MNKEDIIGWSLVIIIYIIISIVICIKFAPSEEELRYRQELESRKGACVEYEGNITGNWFSHGSSGSVECVKWEDTKYKGQYITEY